MPVVASYMAFYVRCGFLYCFLCPLWLPIRLSMSVAEVFVVLAEVSVVLAELAATGPVRFAIAAYLSGGLKFELERNY